MPCVLLTGDWLRSFYEPALASGFRANGWSVLPFCPRQQVPSDWFSQAQRRLKVGPVVARVNQALIELVGQHSPDLLFLHATDLVLPATVARLKALRPGMVIAAFHNDNPYLALRDRIKWRHFLGLHRYLDVAFVYRPSNLPIVARLGARRAAVLPAYYVSYIHRPLPKPDGGFQRDVVYIGHYENDGRANTLDYLHRHGIRVDLFGNPDMWRRAARRLPWLEVGRIRELWDDEYSACLSSARIGLVFLSGRYRDVWTRRCFEIPACGTFMLAPRTAELEQLYADGREAVYYDGPEDLAQKIKFYLTHERDRQTIAAAGRRRCLQDGRDEVARVKQLIGIVREAGSAPEHSGAV